MESVLCLLCIENSRYSHNVQPASRIALLFFLPLENKNHPHEKQKILPMIKNLHAKKNEKYSRDKKTLVKFVPDNLDLKTKNALTKSANEKRHLFARDSD